MRHRARHYPQRRQGRLEHGLGEGQNGRLKGRASSWRIHVSLQGKELNRLVPAGAVALLAGADAVGQIRPPTPGPRDDVVNGEAGTTAPVADIPISLQDLEANVAVRKGVKAKPDTLLTYPPGAVQTDLAGRHIR